MRVDGGITARISKPASSSGATYAGGVRRPIVTEAQERARTALTVEVSGFWCASGGVRGRVPSRRIADTRPTSAAEAITPKTSPVVLSSSSWDSSVHASASRGWVGRMGPGLRCLSQSSRCSGVAAPRSKRTSEMRHASSIAPLRVAAS